MNEEGQSCDISTAGAETISVEKLGVGKIFVAQNHYVLNRAPKTHRSGFF